MEVNREGLGERVVPGACKTLINAVKKKGQRRRGDLETLPRVSQSWGTARKAQLMFKAHGFH